MAFSITWDEANPINGTAAANIDDEIRSVKASVAERLVSVFPNFRTDLNRLNASKICVDAAGLVFRNDTDTTTIATLTNLGQFTPLLSLLSGAYLTVVNGPAGGLVSFPTEIIDTDTFHDNAVNNSRLTIPAGKAGLYFIFATAFFINVGENSGSGAGSFLKILKNGGNPPGVLNNEAIKIMDINPGPSLLSIYVPVVRMCLVSLNVADYMELSVSYTGGVSQTFTNFNFGLIRLG